MKNIVTILAIFLLSNPAICQEKRAASAATCGKPGSLMEQDLIFKAFQFNKHGFSIKGEKADEFIAELKRSHKFKQNGFRTKMKKVEIPGFTESTNIEIYEGVHGYNPETGHYYFHVFQSEEQKAEVLASLTADQKVGYSVYLKNKSFSEADREKHLESVRIFTKNTLQKVQAN